MTALLDRIDKLRALDVDRVPVAEALEVWAELAETVGLDGREPINRETAKLYRSTVRNTLQPILGDKMLGDVDTRYVAWLRHELLDRYSRTKARTALNRFRSCLAECRILGLVSVNAADELTIRLGGRRKPPITVPGADEAMAMLRAADRLASSSDTRLRRTWVRYRPIVYLLRFTGMRIGEILGLPWHAINDQEASISIVQIVDRQRVLGPPKSDAAFRTIHVPPSIIGMMSEWRRNCPDNPDNLVFPGRRGRPIGTPDFGGAPWALLSKEAGLLKSDGTPRFRRHDFRHRLASELIDLGATTKEVQMHMGHASPEVTLRYYGHLLSDRDTLERRRRRINRIAQENWPASP